MPFYGRWQTNGHHWAATSVPFVVLHTGETVVTPTSPAARPVAAGPVISMGGTWTGVSCIMPNCPIIIDTANDGYHLTNVEDGVRFDLDADGTPEQVAWTRAGSDGRVSGDRQNGNGRIDDTAPSCSGIIRLSTARDPDVTAANGFEVLKFLDSLATGATRAPDGRLDLRGTIFSKLLLWRDLNHNGVSEPDELTRVVDEGIVAISTDYRIGKKVDRFGNEFRQVGRLLWSDGESAKVFDVWLKARD